MDTAKRYSRFFAENSAFATPVMSELFVLAVPSDGVVTRKNMQVVIEALANGMMKIPMDERLGALRASRLLGVDLLRKALEEHLDKVRIFIRTIHKKPPSSTKNLKI